MGDKDENWIGVGEATCETADRLFYRLWKHGTRNFTPGERACALREAIEVRDNYAIQGLLRQELGEDVVPDTGIQHEGT